MSAALYTIDFAPDTRSEFEPVATITNRITGQQRIAKGAKVKWILNALAECPTNEKLQSIFEDCVAI